jgi:hypothetical protein
MTSLTRTEAIIRKFSLLKKHITDETSTIEFLPYSAGIFLSKKRGGENPISIYLYSQSGECLLEIEDDRTVEQNIIVPHPYDKAMDLARTYYVVRVKLNVLQVYVPPIEIKKHKWFSIYMTSVLDEERRKAKDELEKTLANLYPKEASTIYSDMGV